MVMASKMSKRLTSTPSNCLNDMTRNNFICIVNKYYILQ